MKLLIVVNVDWFFCSHRLPVALAARRAGYDVHIATTFTSDKHRRVLSHLGFTLHDLYIDRSGRNVFQLLLSFVVLIGVFFRVKPDLLHLVTLQPVLLGGLAAKFLGINRVVYAISGLGHVFIAGSFLGRARLFVIKFLYRISLSARYRAVIFQNKSDLSNLSALCRFNSSEIFLIPGSGVDLSVFSRCATQSESAIVLMASRLLVTKGVNEFVESAYILSGRNVDVRLQLAGQPDTSNPASITSGQLDIWRNDGIVDILGFRSDLHILMSQAHIICLPSYYPEGLPKVLCEAAACGRAIITTDTPGCRDAIEHGVTGLLIPPRDSLALADAIELLVNAPDMVRSMGQASRSRAEKYFDVNLVANKHLDIYRYLSQAC